MQGRDTREFLAPDLGFHRPALALVEAVEIVKFAVDLLPFGGVPAEEGGLLRAVLGASGLVRLALPRVDDQLDAGDVLQKREDAARFPARALVGDATVLLPLKGGQRVQLGLMADEHLSPFFFDRGAPLGRIVLQLRLGAAPA